MNNPRMGLRATLALLLMMFAIRSGGAELLEDINTVPIPASSNPRYLGAVGPNVLFVAGSGTAAADLGLWASDGTIAGTRLIFANSASSGFFNPQGLLTLGARVLWSGPGNPDIQELWTSDGTTAGTVKIGELPGQPTGVVGVIPGGVAVFAAATPSGTAELWRTDGTAAGTFRVAEFDAVDALQSAVIGTQAYFSATTSANGAELWVTDGSNIPSHTHLDADLVPGPDSSGPVQLTAVGNTLYFVAALSDGIAQLFSRDASGAIAQLTADPLGAGILCSVGNLLLYQSNAQIGRSNGTIGGTFPLFSASQSPDVIGPCVPAGNRVFFDAISPGSTDVSLWQSDGTTNGTTPLPIGATPQGPAPVLWSGTHLFFSASDTAHGLELWVTDGTPAGTHIVMDAFPDPERGLPSVIGVAGSQVFVIQSRISTHFPDDRLSEVWRADLNGNNALRLTNNVSNEPYGAPFPYSLIANGHIFFPSGSPTRGIEPSASDGSLAGTVILRDIAPQTQNLASLPLELTLVNGTLLFTADDGVSGRELWRTDGTANGTTRFADIFPGSHGSDPARLGVIDDILYFAANDDVHGQELWLSDGTSTGTHLVADIEPGAGSAGFSCLKMLKLGAFNYFSAQNTAGGAELWRTDGTTAGTQLVVDLVPGATGSLACPLAVVGSSLYFTATDSRGRELWVTDGTAAGTHIAADVVPGAFGSDPTMAVEFQGELVFAAASLPTGLRLPRQLWSTVGGTPTLLLNVAPGGIAWTKASPTALYFAVIGGSAPGVYRWNGGTSVPARFLTDIAPLTTDTPVQLGTRIAFIGTSAAEGEEIFGTDGTQAGTSAMTNVSAPGENNVGGPLVVLGQKLYFVVTSGDGARQLARTDGTPQGTQVLTQFTGQFRGLIDVPTLAGGQVVFSADDGVSEIGYELFVQRNLLPNAANDTASVTAGQSVSINVTANDTDADGTVIPSTVRPFLLAAHGSLVTNASGIITYNANAGFSGTDTFTYVVSDDVGAQSAAGTVTVTVNAPPPPPPPPPPSNSGGGGGGGALELLSILTLGGLVVSRVMRRARLRDSEPLCAGS